MLKRNRKEETRQLVEKADLDELAAEVGQKAGLQDLAKLSAQIKQLQVEMAALKCQLEDYKKALDLAHEQIRVLKDRNKVAIGFFGRPRGLN